MKKIIKFFKRKFYEFCLIEAENDIEHYGKLSVRFCKIKIASLR